MPLMSRSLRVSKEPLELGQLENTITVIDTLNVRNTTVVDACLSSETAYSKFMNKNKKVNIIRIHMH